MWKNRDKKKLEKMTDSEYMAFCMQIAGFEFCERCLTERIECNTNEQFLQNLLACTYTDVFYFPLYQVLFRYRLMLRADKKERWKYVSEYDWDTYREFIKCKDIKSLKLFYEKNFKNGWDSINCSDYKS